jgi:hypothetical protein
MRSIFLRKTSRPSSASGRPGKGNDKGKVEGLVGYARRNFLMGPNLQSCALTRGNLCVSGGSNVLRL